MSPADALAASPPSADAAKKAPAFAPIALPTLSPLVKRVLPAVVNVVAEVPAQAAAADGESAGGQAGVTPFDDFLRRYFEERGGSPAPRQPAAQKGMSLGSGFVIDPAGFIVTNHHVIAGASKITIIFQDNSRHPATLVGSDPKTDLAVLRVTAAAKLPFLEWGDSDKVEVGDWVMTVGNPFGLGGTVTAGIVSALGRDIQHGPFDDFLQIDAPINRGSSGGPAFDTSGHVVGVNTAIYSPSGGNVGIGFAIPSSIARLVVKHLKEEGHANHGYLGVSVQVVGPEIAPALHMDPDNPQGVIVLDVSPDSPADQAGLQVGDVIKSADGHPVQASHDVSRLVGRARVGDKLALTVDRNGAQLEIVATIAKAQRINPDDASGPAARPHDGATPQNSARGVWFDSLTPDRRDELQIPPNVAGVVIGGVAENSPAAAVGLMPGDVVLSIAKRPVEEPEDAAAKLRLESVTGDVLLLVNRHGSMQFLALPGAGRTP